MNNKFVECWMLFEIHTVLISFCKELMKKLSAFMIVSQQLFNITKVSNHKDNVSHLGSTYHAWNSSWWICFKSLRLNPVDRTIFYCLVCEARYLYWFKMHKKREEAEDEVLRKLYNSALDNLTQVLDSFVVIEIFIREVTSWLWI